MGQTRIAQLLVLGASLAAIAHAETLIEPPKPKAEASATVTVTAEASPVELLKTPNPVTVVSSEKLERLGKDNLSDLLQALFPGQATRTGGIGAASSFKLGGARSRDVIVTVDGIRINDVSGLDGANLSTVNLVGIDRAEIQQGSCSARIGSDAMGGAVSLYSVGSAKAGWGGDFRLKGGSSGIVGSTLAPAYGWSNGWLRGALDLQRQDSNLESNRHYRSTGTFIGLGQQLGDWGLATLNYRNAYMGAPLPIAFASRGSAPRPSSDYHEDREVRTRDQILSASLQAELTPALKGSITLGGHKLQRYEPGSWAGAPPIPYQSRNYQASANLSWEPVRVFTLNVAMEALDAHVEVPDLENTLMLEADDKHFSLSAEAQWEIVTNLRLVGSVRWERDAQDVPLDASGQKDERSTNQYTGKGGLNWILPAGFRVYASAGWGFSNPLLYNSVFNAFYGGEALENEKSKFIQAGLSYERGPWTAKLNLSRTLYDNMIYYDGSGGKPIPSWGGWPSGIYANGGGIRLQSAEIIGGYESKRLGLTGFYRNQEARDTSKPEAQQLTSSAVARRPFQSLGLNGYYVLGTVRFDARWSWTGTQYDNRLVFPTHYNDLSLAVAWAAGERCTVTLRGDNLMQPHANKAAWLSRANDYRNDASQVYGYPSQSPSISAELRYRF